MQYLSYKKTFFFSFFTMCLISGIYKKRALPVRKCSELFILIFFDWIIEIEYYNQIQSKRMHLQLLLR